MLKTTEKQQKKKSKEKNKGRRNKFMNVNMDHLQCGSFD